MFKLQEKAEEVSALVASAEERLGTLDKCPFEAKSMGNSLASLQARSKAFSFSCKLRPMLAV